MAPGPTGPQGRLSINDSAAMVLRRAFPTSTMTVTRNKALARQGHELALAADSQQLICISLPMVSSEARMLFGQGSLDDARHPFSDIIGGHVLLPYSSGQQSPSVRLIFLAII